MQFFFWEWFGAKWRQLKALNMKTWWKDPSTLGYKSLEGPECDYGRIIVIIKRIIKYKIYKNIKNIK